MGQVRKSIAGASILALVLSVTSASVVLLSAEPAFAERGGNGNSNRNRDRNENSRGNNGRGAIASELRGLNAAHANQNALENASPNSMPGKLYVYQQAEIEAAAAAAKVETVQGEYDRLIGLTEEEVAVEFPDGGYEDAVTQAAIDLKGAEGEAETAAGLANDALNAASGDRDLSEGALDELKSLLGL